MGDVSGVSNIQATAQDTVDDAQDTGNPTDFQGHLADASRVNATSEEVTGALANVAADTPATVEHSDANRANTALGNDIISLASNPATPQAAQAPLAEAADNYSKMVQAHSSGDLVGAAKALQAFQGSLGKVAQATGGDLSPTNKALSSAANDSAGVLATLQAEAGSSTALPAGSGGGALQSKLAPTLDKLNKTASSETGANALTANAERSTAGDLGALAARLSGSDTPKEVKQAVGKVIGDFNKLVADTPTSKSSTSLATQKADVDKLDTDLQGLTSKLGKAGPNAFGQDLKSNLLTLNDDLHTTSQALKNQDTMSAQADAAKSVLSQDPNTQTNSLTSIMNSPIQSNPAQNVLSQDPNVQTNSLTSIMNSPVQSGAPEVKGNDDYSAPQMASANAALRSAGAIGQNETINDPAQLRQKIADTMKSGSPDTRLALLNGLANNQGKNFGLKELDTANPQTQLAMGAVRDNLVHGSAPGLTMAQTQSFMSYLNKMTPSGSQGTGQAPSQFPPSAGRFPTALYAPPNAAGQGRGMAPMAYQATTPSVALQGRGTAPTAYQVAPSASRGVAPTVQAPPPQASYYAQPIDKLVANAVRQNGGRKLSDEQQRQVGMAKGQFDAQQGAVQTPDIVRMYRAAQTARPM